MKWLLSSVSAATAHPEVNPFKHYLKEQYPRMIILNCCSGSIFKKGYLS